VVLSKLGEALNYSPLYVEDDVMSENVSFKGETNEKTGKVSKAHAVCL